MTLYLFIAVLAAILIFGITAYNSLVKSHQLVKAGWSDIDVQLKRRADLIPQLVETVKGYAKHERQLFIDVTEQRNQARQAGDNREARAGAEQTLSQTTGRLLAVAEDYPELKANRNFLDLQNELSETEDKVEMARRFYNGAVRELNTKVQTFPINIVATPLGFTAQSYFEMSAGERSAPKIGDLNVD